MKKRKISGTLICDKEGLKKIISYLSLLSEFNAWSDDLKSPLERIREHQDVAISKGEDTQEYLISFLDCFFETDSDYLLRLTELSLGGRLTLKETRGQVSKITYYDRGEETVNFEE